MQVSAFVPYHLTVSATFTAEPLQNLFSFWSMPLNSQLSVEFSPYNQVVQTLLDPAGRLSQNRHGANVVLFRLADMGQPERWRENLETLGAALRNAAARLPAPLLVIPCPDASAVDGAALLETFLARLASTPNLYLLTEAWIDTHYSVRQKLSPAADRLAKIPYTDDFYTALGTSIVRAVQSMRQPAVKVLALDCDQTLWQGVCGEDGPEGVRLEAGHRAVQEFALAQREQGVLLVLLSKNNEADVRETFACHPEFPLRWEHITAHRINWQPKSQGLVSLARELSLGIDSFAFLDDNAKEIAEVAEQAPQVTGLCLPDDPSAFAVFLQHAWCFDRLKVTKEDLERAASYTKVAEFGRALEESPSLEDFYQNLELEIDIRPLAEEEWTRAAQLTQRTNQFNLTTIRRSEGELRQLAPAIIQGIHVRDRFGDYGFTGLLILETLPTALRLETFLLSCRVLGRGVEHGVLAWVGREAAAAGISHVEIPFRETARNTPAKEFLAAAAIQPRMEAAALLNLHFTPGTLQMPAAPESSSGDASARPAPDYQFIALHLRAVEAIRQAVREQSRQQSVRKIDEPPSTPTEAKLAAIWQDLLQRDDIAASDNFFDVGGHSLLVVLMIVRIREEFGVELGIDEVYAADRHLASLAARIDELVYFGGVDSAEYQQIVAHVAALTDQEVTALLLSLPPTLPLSLSAASSATSSHAHSSRR